MSNRGPRRGAHLGRLASPLVDGMLSPAQAERCARHLAGCSSCRAVLEQEAEVKERLARLAEPPLGTALEDTLRLVPYAWPAAPAAEELTSGWARPPFPGVASRRSRVIGVGASAAVAVGALVGAGGLGLVALSGPGGTGLAELPEPRPAEARITGPTSQPSTRFVVAPTSGAGTRELSALP